MLAFLKRIITPPDFDDEATNHQAYLLHIILWVLVIIPLPYVLYVTTQTPEYSNRALWEAGIGEIVNVFLLVLLRRGHVRSAASIQVIAFWFFFAISAINQTGIQGEAYLLGFPLVIVIAGILLGGQAAFTVTVCSLIAGGAILIASTKGLIRPAPPNDETTTWILSLTVFPMSATLQYLGSRAINNALRRASASEERYRLISRVSTDYTFATDVDEQGKGKLIWVAGALESMTGYTFEEYVSTGSWEAKIHPDDLAKDAHDMEMLRQNKDIRSDIRTFKKNGEICWERVFAHPVWDEKQNRLVRIVGAVQDVTVQKQVEAERESLILELEKKNAELERFTYTVSHDLKSPLVTIVGFLGYLEKDAERGEFERLKQDINKIKQAAYKMQELLNDLLELSRIGRLMNASTNIQFGEIVREALELVQGQIKAKQVLIEFTDSSVLVHGDRLRLVEVIQNLVDNACKFMGEQTKPHIKIGTIIDEYQKPIFFVRDNGIGIASQYHDRIFGLFNKLDAHSEGSGIGLTLVKRIIEVHNGRIWLESKPGEGTTFYFTLQENA